MSSLRIATSLIFSVVYFLIGHSALAGVQVQDLKVGQTVQVVLPADIYQYEWSPMGAGMSEPGLRKVHVEPGATFIVTYAVAKDWSESSYYFFTKNHHMIDVVLETTAPDSEVKGLSRTFRIKIKDPTDDQKGHIHFLNFVN